MGLLVRALPASQALGSTGVLPTRSRFVYLLLAAEKAFQEGGAETGDWADSYAAFILDNQPA